MPLQPKATILILSALLLYPICTFPQDNEKIIKEYYRRGRIYYEHGLYPEAETMFKKAIDLSKKSNIDLKNLLNPAPAIETSQTIITPKIKQKENIPPLQPEDTKPDSYIVGVEDTLAITVWENPDLTREVIVRQDGKISFPLVGEITAQDRTIPQINREITQRLKDYIRFPEVSISLKKMGGNKVIILGQVYRPGIYALSGRKTVIEGIASAGGFNNDAVMDSIVVISGGFDAPRARRVNLSRALNKGAIEEDLLLASQDIVFVPKKFIANVNYFMMKLLDPLTKGSSFYLDTKKW